MLFGAHVSVGWLSGAILLLLLVLLNSCSLYHKEFKTSPPQGKPYELFVVQADDFGSLWSVSDAQGILDHVEAVSKARNVTVVVFIHGWHHNAAANDSNYVDFEKRLAAIDSQLNGAHFASLRQAASGQARTQVIGLYVAWRGRALPSALDYFTLWWRKDAAERVGDGDIREFVLRLQRIYLRANSIGGMDSESTPHPHMGLVTFGHSLGAQVLIKSVAATMERSLAERAPRVASTVEPPNPSAPATAVRVPIDSFGDINILINPATEAYQFARIDALSRELQYPWCQLPQVLVLSSDKDVPRRAFFPIARGLTRPFRPGFRNSSQGALWGTALGMLSSQKTHELLASGDSPSLVDSDYDSEAGRLKILQWDFSGPSTFGQVSLAPRLTTPIANSPVIVATEPGVLIADHNDIFEPRLWNFIVDYVGFMEGKRLLVQQMRLHQKVYNECPKLPPGT